VAVRSLSVAARTGEAGQGTVEYALVLLGAAAVALALVAWVTRSDAVSRLFDAVVGRILSRA
jgi:Flp pilus assembly pilin Flp